MYFQQNYEGKVMKKQVLLPKPNCSIVKRYTDAV